MNIYQVQRAWNKGQVRVLEGTRVSEHSVWFMRNGIEQREKYLTGCYAHFLVKSEALAYARTILDTEEDRARKTLVDVEKAREGLELLTHHDRSK